MRHDYEDISVLRARMAQRRAEFDALHGLQRRTQRAVDPNVPFALTLLGVMLFLGSGVAAILARVVGVL